MIHLKKVTKYYNIKGKKKYIFKDISFSIPVGINLGILGRNGVGKSTLLRMLGGIDYPNSGKIETDVSFSWPLGLSGGFQGSLTGKENAKFVCRFYGKSEEQVKQSLQFIREFSELGSYFNMPIKTYSSGMRAKLGFAMSMAFDFDYYLIDEALAVGDKKFKEKSSKALNDLKAKRNVILVSHNMSVLREMCDSGILLNNGQLTYFEDINDAVEAYKKV